MNGTADWLTDASRAPARVMRARDSEPASHEVGKRGSWFYRHRHQLYPLLGLLAFINVVTHFKTWKLLWLTPVWLVAAAFVAWRYRVRPRIQVVGGSIWLWSWRRFWFRWRIRRELKTAIIEWRAGAERAKVKGSYVRRGVGYFEEGLAELHIDLAAGHVLRDLEVGRAGSLIRAIRGTVHMQPGHREHQVVVSWEHGYGPTGGEEEDEEPEPNLGETYVSPSFHVVNDEPAPVRVDEAAAKLEHLREVFRSAGGPISGREAERRAGTGITRDWVQRVGVPELKATGEIRQGSRGWEWVG